MINKKLVGTALIGLMTAGFAVQASAAVVDRGDGFTDVDAVNNAKMIVNGTLGESDNTDPGENLPEGDDAWINVTIPTAVVFQASDSQVIYSPAYEIKNNSGRGVKVSVKEYNITNNLAGLAALSELNIVNSDDNNTVKLAENGASVVAAEQEFGSIKVGENMGFKFTGNVDKDGLSTEKTENRVESNVVFGFKAIPKTN